MDIKDKYTQVFLKAAELPCAETDIKHYRAKWWSNIRSKDNGLRLTAAGLEFVQECAKIRTYEVKLADDIVFTPQVILWLDEFLNSPYFVLPIEATLYASKIIVLKERAAFELYLYAGDVRKLGHSRALAKQYDQNGVQ